MVQLIDTKFVATLTELSSESIGGRVLSVSDEFFAEAFHLIKTEPAPSLKGQFGPKGALFSGWETRRHNTDHDWCILQLGAPGNILAVDIDTAHFNGNEAPAASLEAITAPGETDLSPKDRRWIEVIPRQELGPNRQHLLEALDTGRDGDFTHVQLKIYPDGGVARLRVYGLVRPFFPENVSDLFDLAFYSSGGRVVAVSDQHFGKGGNLILPGRGKDMGDGWETKRSRVKGHKDWATILLGCPGYLDHVEVDTNHFMGNYPESVEVHAISSLEMIPPDSASWTLVLPRTKTGPHRRHFFHLENVADQSYTHVRVTMHPDGGIKRIRVMGRRSMEPTSLTIGRARGTVPTEVIGSFDVERLSPSIVELPFEKASVSALPLTQEAFSPFGAVVQAYSNPFAVPRGMKVVDANQGSAVKFVHDFVSIDSSYPDDVEPRPTTRFAVYRASPAKEALPGKLFPVRLLERHPYNNQAFFCIGNSTHGKLWESDLEKPGRAYLVVVALSGDDGKPDLSTLRAFIASVSQGIVYGTGVWHHPLISFETTMDFACVETQIGNGSKLDCEIVDLETQPIVQIPVF